MGHGDLRILICSQPKTGNTWVKHLLKDVYGLGIATLPPSNGVGDLAAWLEVDGSGGGWVGHQHYPPTPALLELAAAQGLHLVTTIRDPYDAFTSQFHFVQNFPKLHRHIALHAPIVDKPIDHPDVLDWIATTFKAMVAVNVAWTRKGASDLVRYEALLADPERRLADLCSRIAPATAEAVAGAVVRNDAASMRRLDATMARFVRTATSGDHQNHLGPIHYEVFRSHFAPEFEALGYRLR